MATYSQRKQRTTTIHIPATPQSITPDWLTAALRAGATITEANVSTVKIKVFGDTQGATGQMARLTITYDAAAPNAPATMIAKLSTADPAMRAGVQKFKMYEREVRFYEKLAPQVALRTPECYYSAIDLETGLCVLLLEDMVTGRNPDKFGTCSPDEARLAITEIARFHAAWWESPHLAEMDWIPSVKLQRLDRLYQQHWEPFLEEVGQILPKPMLDIGQRLQGHIADLNLYLTASPRTICHRDYQPANLFFFTAPNDTLSLTVIDWQTLTLGRGIIDIALFAGRCVPPEVRRQEEMVWLQMYHMTLVENGVNGYSFDECLYDYRMAMFINLFRMVWLIVTGNLSPEEETGFREVILPRNCAAIMDLDSVTLLDDLSR